MAVVAVLPSVLGLRAGIEDAATRLGEAGHEVRVVDVLEGATHDAYEPAMAAWEELGSDVLRARALDAVADLPDGFSCVAFSAGGELAVHLALHRPVAALVLQAGSVSVHWFPEADGWPARTGVQQHDATGDPFRDEGVEQLAEDVRAAGAELESHDYALPGPAHLFTDPSLPTEFDADAAELLWERALSFLGRDR